jgi:hypothetical protein
MNVQFEDGTITIKNIRKEAAEIMLESLVRFINTTLKNKMEASMTEEEKNQLRQDKKQAHEIYDKINRVYDENLIRLVDANKYDEELVR